MYNVTMTGERLYNIVDAEGIKADYCVTVTVQSYTRFILRVTQRFLMLENRVTIGDRQ